VTWTPAGLPAPSGSPSAKAPVAPTEPGGGPARIRLAVVAAHRTGHPLHHQLAELGAQLVATSATAPVYRLLALGGQGVARGGIVWAGPAGATVEVEVHDLPLARLGSFVAALPPPLAVGRVALADSSWVLGLLCSHVPDDAHDVTEYGSWPRYLASPAAPAAR
jgi:allophanate hydrolase